MSQKAYMWNGNNPYAYNDPSGFGYEPPCDAACAHRGNAVAAAIYQFVIGDDVDTLRGKGTVAAKMLAVASIAVDLTGWGAADKLGGKAIFAITAKNLTHVLDSHLAGERLALERACLPPALKAAMS